ncbi:response regulator [Crenobacter sp. SG2305]|uniref:response regulator n=1 Tax=Crenobacter oryzisoli TaxID=3056844 RepID=UPI0025AB50AF|nr:response regulator [Crenobacter sp. SG2305]MDN0082681.1 response regulator [Crenobacter sp. SG2305]
MSIDYSKLRVLLVDDQMLVRSLLIQTLKSMGFHPELIAQASDGTAALRLLQVRPVDLVICDIEMRPMNGLELLKELRCGHTLNAPNLPFLFLSGHSGPVNVVQAIQLHADDFIVKPPTPAEVEKAIRLTMSRPRPLVDPFAYYTAQIDDSGFVGRRFAQAPLESDPAQELELWDVPAEALLAKDLLSKSGHLLLPAGSRITAGQLNVLREHHDRYGVSHIAVVPEETSEQ